MCNIVLMFDGCVWIVIINGLGILFVDSDVFEIWCNVFGDVISLL